MPYIERMPDPTEGIPGPGAQSGEQPPGAGPGMQQPAPSGPGMSGPTQPGMGQGLQAAVKAGVGFVIQTLHKGLVAFPPTSEEFKAISQALNILIKKFGDQGDRAGLKAMAGLQAMRPGGGGQGSPVPQGIAANAQNPRPMPNLGAM